MCLPNLTQKEKKLNFPSLIPGENQNFTVGEMSFIIEQRVKEILWKVQRTLDEHKIMKHCARGIVISGGGALLAGFDEMCAQVFETPIRKGEPRYLNNLPKGTPSLSLTTATGLLSHSFFPKEEENPEIQDSEHLGIGNIFKDVWKKIKEPFVNSDTNHF